MALPCTVLILDMKKKDGGMAKRFSKMYGNNGKEVTLPLATPYYSTTCNPKVMSRCLSA